MTLRLFDEAQGKKVAFVPEGGAALGWRVRLRYGDRVSLSDVRPGVVVDVLGRWLAFKGYAVTCCREVIDTDLQPSTAAAREGRSGARGGTACHARPLHHRLARPAVRQFR